MWILKGVVAEGLEQPGWMPLELPGDVPSARKAHTVAGKTPCFPFSICLCKDKKQMSELSLLVCQVCLASRAFACNVQKSISYSTGGRREGVAWCKFSNVLLRVCLE